MYQGRYRMRFPSTQMESRACHGKSENLLSQFLQQKSKVLRFRRRWENWEIISGSWKSRPESRVILNGNARDANAEPMAMIGSRCWSDIELQVTFQFLTGTMNPPDGGAIVFFLAKNRNNHLAFHFCVGKHSLQLFKKVRGIWAMIGEKRFEFLQNRKYVAQIHSSSGIHHCRMEDGTCLQVLDSDISSGRVGIGGKFCVIEFDWLSVTAC
jgi:hypothetical protein